MITTSKKIRLEDLNISQMTCGWGNPFANKTILERPITIRGKVYENGIGTHALSELVVNLKGVAKSFEAIVGVDDETDGQGTVSFEVWVDDALIAESGHLDGKAPPYTISADLTSGKTLKLIAKDTQNETHYAHANWADAIIELIEDATEIPESCLRQVRQAPPPNIERVKDITPRLNNPRVVGSTPGNPFLFRIPVTGIGPFTFEVKNLPDGLTIDSTMGIISGSLKNDCDTDVLVRVKNSAGEISEKIRLIGGKKKLTQTPPMGWNSWNVWGLAVDHDKVKAAADMLVSSGLADHGYQYVNIDDGWEAGRAPDGTILTNEKFPDMKGLSDYIHSKGLKFGIYSSPGPLTCGGFTGSYEHEEQDALTYAKWGVDFLKYDWCSYGEIAKDKSLEELQKPYKIMAAALQKCDRDIVYSLCQYGMGQVWQWGEEVGANLWRTTGDITDSWNSMRSIGFRQHENGKYAGPGHWNDPDMLVLGHVGWGPNLHSTNLTQHEQLTHMSLWCLLAAPLLIGCDLTKLDEFTLSVLMNGEAIAVNQDVLGVQASRIYRDDFHEVWARPLADGTLAVGLFNRAPGVEQVSISWEQLGVSGSQLVRDLWLHKDLGDFKDSFTTDVAGHEVSFVKIGTPRV